ncbi:MAG: hypothetical protein HN948_06125, partial [Clostridia bacterium]|nr:hypothetical protein [Clostridia bacterium]
MKKKLLLLILVMLITLSLFTTIAAAAPKEKCNSVTTGGVFYSAGHYLAGQEITTGYDIFGYNYQAHYFKGSYVNVYLGRAGLPPYMGDDAAYLAANPTAASHWAWPYREYMVEMKWNDAWISNKDQDGDGALDRHYGYDTYIGSGAWEYYRDYLLDDQGAVIYESSSKII